MRQKLVPLCNQLSRITFDCCKLFDSVWQLLPFQKCWTFGGVQNNSRIRNFVGHRKTRFIGSFWTKNLYQNLRIFVQTTDI